MRQLSVNSKSAFTSQSVEKDQSQAYKGNQDHHPDDEENRVSTEHHNISLLPAKPPYSQSDRIPPWQRAQRRYLR